MAALHSVSPGQIAVMSAIVATLMLPAAALIAAICSIVFGVSPHALVSFGDTFNEPVGLMVWWAAALVPGCAYAILSQPN